MKSKYIVFVILALTIGIAVAIALLAFGNYLFISKVPSAPTAPAAPGVPPVGVVAKNLEVPWAITFAQDGRLFFTERAGRVNVIENSAVRKIADAPVAQTGESGLHGIALSADYIYIYYTYSRGGTLLNRVSRFKERAGLASEEIILDNISGASLHDGGRIKFGPDGKLYITTGDALQAEQAQNVSSLVGKILRINPDGSIPVDNPFPNSPVYSYGHRNPQGLAWNSGGALFATEHGTTAMDEINLITSGKNYGWPRFKCDARTAGFEDPLACFKDFTLAPTGAAFLGGELYVAGLRGAQIRKITFDQNLEVVSNEAWLTGYGRIRDVVAGADGYLYFTTSNKDGRGAPAPDDDKILRIKP